MALNVVSSDRLSTNVKVSNLATVLSSKVGTNKNIIINGAMQVSQRGNVTGITASSYGGPDRFKYVDNSDVTVTINAATVTNLSGFGKAYQLDVTTADAAMASNHFAHIRQTLEGQDLQAIKKGFADAEPLTLSFWVYTNKTGNYTVHMYDSDNTRHCSQLYSVSSANTWEKKTLTFPADTTGKFTNDNNVSMEIDWNLAAGTNYTSGTLATSWASYTAANASAGLNVNLLDNTSNEFYLTGVQLEVGSVATDFEHRSYGDELLRCKRYFHRLKGYTTFTPALPGCYNNDTSVEVAHHFPVEMRDSPTFAYGAALSNFDIEPFDNQPNNLSLRGASSQAAGIQSTGNTSQTKGYAASIVLHNNGAYMDFTAEL